MYDLSMENNRRDESLLPQPVKRSLRVETSWSGVTITGPSREIELHGRRGLNALSTKTLITLPDPEHTLNQTRGALTFWILALEDYGYFFEPSHLTEHEPDYAIHPLLTDHPELRRIEDAHFFLIGRNFWFRPIIYKFSRTEPDDVAWNCHGERAAHGPDDFHFHPHNWYQIGLSWNHESGLRCLYANGIRLTDGREHVHQFMDPARKSLHTGCPLFAMGELAFYNEELTSQQFKEIYSAEATQVDETILQELQNTYEPNSLGKFVWDVDGCYRKELDLSLTKQAHLNHFYVQGDTRAPKATPDGLLVETPVPSDPPYHFFNNPMKAANSQVFLHTWRTFEGDIAFELDFMSLKEEGLSFVMFHSSGMQREDYMKDYALRTTGAMNMTFGENVRNYHWEFYRDMDGIRKDRTTSLLFKNPRLCARAYQVLPEWLPLNTWHTLRLIQDGRRFRGGINDTTVFDITEDPHDRSGGTYTFGHFSLRTMFKSKFLWRNLRIYVRPPIFTSKRLSEKASNG
jgi:hypothetical protein